MRELACILATNSSKKESEDELDAVLGPRSLDGCPLADIEKMILRYDLEKILDEDVIYVFSLFKKS